MNEKRYSNTKALMNQRENKIGKFHNKKKDVEVFVNRLRKASKFIRHESLDNAMLYSITNRIINITNNLNEISIVKCTSEKTIKKKLTNNLFVKHFNLNDKFGISCYKRDIYPVWGYPKIGNIVTFKNITDESYKGKIFFKEKEESDYSKDKIYFVLVKSTISDYFTKMNNYKNNMETQTNDIKPFIFMNNKETFELVLIKSDINSNNKL